MGGPRLVQWSRFSDAWGRLFGIQGATQLNAVDDCFITLDAEDDALHLSYLRGWAPWAQNAAVAAVAAQFQAVRLNVLPGRLCVIDGFSVSGTVAGQEVIVGVRGDQALAAAQVVAPRDTRLSPQVGLGGPAGYRAGVGMNPVSNAASLLGTAGQAAMRFIASINTAAPVPWYVPWVVANGVDLVFENTVVNQGLAVQAWGRVRELTQQEI